MKRILLGFFLLNEFFILYAQEIITAERYLESVGEVYGNVRDYEARIVIRSGNSTMYGTVSHLIPSFLRIDFTSPANQVILYDGNLLTMYLPEYQAVLNQVISASRRPSGASMATAQGILLLRRNYVPAFVTDPSPVPLESGSNEMVVKLRLTRRVGSENFREIFLDIASDTKLIRRIEGRTITDSTVRFDFSETTINQGIPEQRFIYDSPASANLYNNFLFRDSE
ncbi:MAG: outer-membrane lipoprotein carrier protein LolA [Spirochaetaceae bacterium]|nr:outer-membrane lipoprotein carrier protein LolA [Spirochaetaceae bacterium]